MKRVFFWVLFGQLFAVALNCVAQEKISILDLLDLTTRERALQDFVLRADPVARISGWDDRGKFAADYRDIDVLACYDRQAKKSRYAVTWKTKPRFDGGSIYEAGYPKTDDERLFPSIGPGGLLFPTDLGISVFENDGSLIELNGLRHLDITGFVKDLAGDGSMEVMSEGESGSTKYVMVQPLTGPQPVFAVAYEWGDWRARGKAWGYAIRNNDNGSYDILFGPREKDSINPEAVFRYDGHLGTWVSENASEHLRVLNLKNAWMEIVKLGEAPRARASTQESVDAISIFDSWYESLSMKEWAQLTEAQAPGTYRYESLTAIGNADLVAWMAPGRSLWNVKSESIRLAPADFWAAEVKAATLAFVLHNRPKEVEDSYRMAIDDLDGKEAPKEGTVSVLVALPLQDYGGLGEEYFLRCSQSDSYLTVIRHSGPAPGSDPLVSDVACDLRKIPLAYEEALRVLQTTWWLDRVRSKRVSEIRVDGGLISLEGTWAILRLESALGKIEITGPQYEAPLNGKIGISASNADYDQHACLNMAVLLLSEELPRHLGERWRRFDLMPRQPLHGLPGLLKNYTAKQLETLKSDVAAQLRDFQSGGLGFGTAQEVVKIVRDLDLSELLPELEKAAKRVPAPTVLETRLKEIARGIAECRSRLGPNETDEASSERRRKAKEAEVIQAKYAAMTGEKKPEFEKPASSPEPDPKFTTLDALYSEQTECVLKKSIGEIDAEELRDLLDETIRWFRMQDNSELLYAFASESEERALLACRTLRKIDPDRAIAALVAWQGRETDGWYGLYLRQALDEIRNDQDGGKDETKMSGLDRRAVLRITGLPPAANEEMQAAGLMETVGDSGRIPQDRKQAIELLAPFAAPMRFPQPAVDDFLAKIIQPEERRDDEWLRPQASRALAQRGGGKWWDIIAESCEEKEEPRLAQLLPALVMIANKDGEPFRGKLRDFISAHLKTTYGDFDSVLWAAWMADLRELKPEIEKVATSKPEDVEGALGKANSNVAITEPGRYHTARQIVSLWNEEDVATRVKMLIALGTEQRNVFGEEPAAGCLESAVMREAGKLTAEQRKAVMEFIEWRGSDAATDVYLMDKQASDWLAKARRWVEVAKGSIPAK